MRHYEEADPTGLASLIEGTVNSIDKWRVQGLQLREREGGFIFQARLDSHHQMIFSMKSWKSTVWHMGKATKNETKSQPRPQTHPLPFFPNADETFHKPLSRKRPTRHFVVADIHATLLFMPFSLSFSLSLDNDFHPSVHTSSQVSLSAHARIRITGLFFSNYTSTKIPLLFPFFFLVHDTFI